MTDEEIVALCSKGEETAFEALIEKYHSDIYKYIYSFTKEHQLAEDLTQETFIKIVNNIENFSFKLGAKLSTWLYTIAKNVVMDEFRKRKIRLEWLESSDVIYEITSEDSLEDDVIKQVDLETVKAAMENLSGETRAILYLRYFKDLSYKDIANIFSCNTEKVKWRLHDAIKKIKYLVSSEGVNSNEKRA